MKEVSASRFVERDERLDEPRRVRIGEDEDGGESQMPGG